MLFIFILSYISKNILIFLQLSEEANKSLSPWNDGCAMHITDPKNRDKQSNPFAKE